MLGIARRNCKTLVVLLTLVLGVVFIAAPNIYAQTNSISEGYSTQDKLISGALVAYSAANRGAVDIASTENRDRLLGIAVSTSEALISFSNGGRSVQVMTSGTVPVQVSTLNGIVHSGDYLTASPVKGVAMRATTAGKVIGVAQQDFTETNAGTNQTVSTKNGNKTIRTGTVSTTLGVQDWVPDKTSTALITNARNFLSSLTGKPVSGTQAFFSIAIAILAVFIAGIVVYSAISASIHSIGRNPLSKHTVHRSLVFMLGLAAIVIIGAGSAIYLILER